MSKLEVDKIDPQSGTNLELGTSGDTVTIPTGVTLDASNATTSLPATVVTTDGTQTLTNKSIAASQLTGTITPSDGTVTGAKLNNDIISAQTELASEPADTDEFLVSDAGTLKRIDYSLIKGGGITVADQFRLTAQKSVTSTGSDITANWERIDGSGQGTLGSGMTESSGIFSFPETGIYYIVVNLGFFDTTANQNDSRYFEFKINATTNNSSYNTISRMNSSLKYISDHTYQNLSVSTFFDVTNTSTHKIKFTVESQNNTFIAGSTSLNESNDFTFIRLGDT